ncbi:MAG: septum site-determining protein MinC [Synechococcaceae cyanobacterium]|nr:septum site-determining protein MinC [Synechococcaceae cyanobacterium]
MAARLVPAPTPGLPHLLLLPDDTGSASAQEEVSHGLGETTLCGPVALEAADWLLRLPQLRELQQLLERHGLTLRQVAGQRRETLVAAAALGLETQLRPQRPGQAPAAEASPAPASPAVTVHRGPLRSGDHLRSDGSVLLLGDLNPGGRITAAGHVFVWGRLRGVAHAGCDGDRDARIVALQLRPLQLRIADAVARGPEEPPQTGMAEQAWLCEGLIRIDPAKPVWPLTESSG